MAEHFGGKHTLGFGMITSALFTIITPLTISWGGSTALICLRALMGACEGITQPAIAVMMAQWTPADERSKMTSIVNMGAICGVIVISLSFGPVIRLTNWSGVYYLFGGIGVLWYVLWLKLCYNNPREHPFISEAEAKELNEKLRGHTHANVPPVPWKQLFSSAPFWALVAASIGRDWDTYTVLSDLPKYTMNVLKFTADEMGLLFLSMNTSLILSSLSLSWLADWLINKGYVSITSVRKIMGTISLSFRGFTLVLTSYTGCNKLQFSIIQSISVSMASGAYPGMKANVLDLSPNYAGTVMAVSHGLAGTLLFYVNLFYFE